MRDEPREEEVERRAARSRCTVSSRSGSDSRPTKRASVSSSWGGQAFRRNRRKPATAIEHAATPCQNVLGVTRAARGTTYAARAGLVEAGVSPGSLCRVTAPEPRAVEASTSGPFASLLGVPIYEYKCPKGHVFELFQKMSDPPPEVCIVCGEGPLQKVLYPVAAHFKGSGFTQRTRAQGPKPSGDGDKPSKSDSGDKGDRGARRTSRRSRPDLALAPAAADRLEGEQQDHRPGYGGQERPEIPAEANLLAEHDLADQPADQRPDDPDSDRRQTPDLLPAANDEPRHRAGNEPEENPREEFTGSPSRRSTPGAVVAGRSWPRNARIVRPGPPRRAGSRIRRRSVAASTQATADLTVAALLYERELHELTGGEVGRQRVSSVSSRAERSNREVRCRLGGTPGPRRRMPQTWAATRSPSGDPPAFRSQSAPQPPLPAQPSARAAGERPLVDLFGLIAGAVARGGSGRGTRGSCAGLPRRAE